MGFVGLIIDLAYTVYKEDTNLQLFVLKACISADDLLHLMMLEPCNWTAAYMCVKLLRAFQSRSIADMLPRGFAHEVEAKSHLMECKV